MITKNEEDDQLVERAKQEPAAFAALYRKYQRSIFRFFWYRVHDVELSGDFAQETFIRAFTSLKKFNRKGYSYLTYLRRIAQNLLIDHFRKPTTELLEAAEKVVDPKEEKRDVSFDIEAMSQSMKQLSVDDQEILKLFYMDQLSLQEIGTQKQRSVNAVKLKLSRARRKLKKIVGTT